MESIPATLQKEKNGKMLPGPRDDFCFVTPETSIENPEIKPIYLIGGFNNGTKMNDIYRLSVLD